VVIELAGSTRFEFKKSVPGNGANRRGNPAPVKNREEHTKRGGLISGATEEKKFSLKGSGAGFEKSTLGRREERFSEDGDYWV